jgi:nucleoside-diphosphate-sugar epimerase
MILITGSSGFVGTNLLKYLFEFNIEANGISLRDNSDFSFNSNSGLIHLAGIAHDLKFISNPRDYYDVNTELTKELFNKFLQSNSKLFIFISSVKAVADQSNKVLTEDTVPNPITHYGKSKLLAEKYILSQKIPKDKRLYILRPCMIHGPGNKGNLNLLYNIVSKGYPWPLGKFVNSRSYSSIENLCFVIKELIERTDIPSGVYNVCDDIPISTNELVQLIAESKGNIPKIYNINKSLIYILARLGDQFKLPLNTERLIKLTENYFVSNSKIISAINKPLPQSSKEGMIKTLKSFSIKIN